MCWGGYNKQIFMVHQDSSLNLLIYACNVKDTDLDTVDCPDNYYKNIKLTSKIVAFTYEITYTYPNFLIVTADQPNIVQTYTDYGSKLYTNYDFK